MLCCFPLYDVQGVCIFSERQKLLIIQVNIVIVVYQDNYGSIAVHSQCYRIVK